MGFRAQKDLAEKADISTVTLGRIEAENAEGLPDPETIARLAQALKCEESDLFQVPAQLRISPKQAMEVILDSLNLEGKLKRRPGEPDPDANPLLEELIDLASTLNEDQLRFQVRALRQYLRLDPAPKISQAPRGPKTQKA